MSNTITVELNRDSVIHLLKYIRGIYLEEHTEQGETYEPQRCPYCITLLTSLSKELHDEDLKDNLDRIRTNWKQRLLKTGDTQV